MIVKVTMRLSIPSLDRDEWDELGLDGILYAQLEDAIPNEMYWDDEDANEKEAGIDVDSIELDVVG